MTEFLNSFEGTRGSVDGVVTREEFQDYYANLSAFIDTDVYARSFLVSQITNTPVKLWVAAACARYFVTVVRNAWKL